MSKFFCSFSGLTPFALSANAEKFPPPVTQEFFSAFPHPRDFFQARLFLRLSSFFPPGKSRPYIVLSTQSLCPPPPLRIVPLGNFRDFPKRAGSFYSFWSRPSSFFNKSLSLVIPVELQTRLSSPPLFCLLSPHSLCRRLVSLVLFFAPLRRVQLSPGTIAS